MSTAGDLVEGMTCGYCMGKVHERIRSLSGVTKVAMDLGSGGLSPLLVTSGTTLGPPWCAVPLRAPASDCCRA